MDDKIQMHDVVALLEDPPAKHFLTGQELLRRGQIGTVVMSYDGVTFEIEFAGRDGRAYAILPVGTDKLRILREETVSVHIPLVEGGSLAGDKAGIRDHAAEVLGAGAIAGAGGADHVFFDHDAAHVVCAKPQADLPNLQSHG